MKSAVLFLIFNRPDTTKHVFEAIREAKPPRLYVAADGPRPGRDGEKALCEKSRQITSVVDWPCEIKTLFQEENQGCKLGVSRGISWFFEHESEGIILEDDILPLPSFFQYCDSLLERYRYDQRIAMISGCNLVSKHFKIKDSYAFSQVNHIWGWASWRRSWDNYDVEMKEWPSWENQGALKALSHGDRSFYYYWKETFENAYAGKIDTWDYQWTFACWANKGLSVLPKYSLIKNLGFSESATHTKGEAPDYVVEAIPQEIIFPLSHPKVVKQNLELDNTIHSRVYLTSRMAYFKLLLYRIPGIQMFLEKFSRILNSA